MQSISAAASHGIIKSKLEIVVAQEPVESRPSSTPPAAVTSHSVRLQTRRNRTGSFNRLLIEAGLLTALAIKSSRPDWYKVAVGFATLRFHKPIQRIESDGKHTFVRASCPHKQHGLRQPRISVRHNVLKPSPVRTPDRLIHFEQTPGQCESYSLGVAISRVRMEVFLNPQQGIGPGARAAEFHNCGKRK